MDEEVVVFQRDREEMHGKWRLWHQASERTFLVDLLVSAVRQA